jgi:coenzyme PQQ synthesis protein D (PqqD)
VIRDSAGIEGTGMQFQRASGVMHELLDGHAVLLDPDAVRMLTLNPVGTLVWELLDEDRTCAELVTLLTPKVRGVTAEQLEADVRSFLDELVEARVVVIASDEPA